MTEQKRYYWLDWLRFAAAFLVLLCHARGYNWAAWERIEKADKTCLAWIFFATTRPGLEAVVVFFVLSGFLVGGKILVRIKNGTFDPTAYALDRISRIYVPLFPALLLTVIISLICGSSISIRELLGNMFGLQGLLCDSFANNGPLWSLAYEFWFYLLGGGVALIIGCSYRLNKLAVFGVALTFVVFTRLDASLLFCWCLGTISYSLLSKRLNWVWFFVGVMLAVVGCGFSQVLSDSISVNTKVISAHLPSRAVATLILSLGLAFIVPFLAQKPPGFKMLIAFERAGTKLAAFSYTLYLTHYPMLGLWDYYIHERFMVLNFYAFLVFAVKLSSCLLVSFLLYIPFEAQTDHVRAWARRRWIRANQ